jgi:hypothetical protein
MRLSLIRALAQMIFAIVVKTFANLMRRDQAIRIPPPVKSQDPFSNVHKIEATNL